MSTANTLQVDSSTPASKKRPVFIKPSPLLREKAAKGAKTMGQAAVFRFDDGSHLTRAEIAETFQLSESMVSRNLIKLRRAGLRVFARSYFQQLKPAA